eukprot:7151020-Prymnesium_polylepis.2
MRPVSAHCAPRGGGGGPCPCRSTNRPRLALRAHDGTSRTPCLGRAVCDARGWHDPPTCRARARARPHARPARRASVWALVFSRSRLPVIVMYTYSTPG